MKRLWIITLLLVASLGYNAYSHWKYERLALALTLIDQKDKLHQQSVDEMMWARMTEVREGQIDAARGQGKIEGMLAVITNQKPNSSESNEIWHAGYYRGLDQSKDMLKSPGDDTVPVTNKKDTDKKDEKK